MPFLQHGERQRPRRNQHPQRAGIGLPHHRHIAAPALRRIRGRGHKVDFWVVELRDGWAHITDVGLYSETHPDRRLASGWIASNFLLFDIQSDYVFERPDPKSRIVATTWFDKGGDHAPRGRPPFECQGEWVHLMVTGHGKVERPAWARGLCGNADTTCDGLPYDGPKSRRDLPHY